MTASGSRAIASHTGSMAGENRIWDAFFAQTGAIRVYSLEEMIDVVLAFMHLKPPKGRRTLLLGGGGGNSVAFADICGRAGLEIPPLHDNTRKELNTYIQLAGNSTRNPLDLWMVQRDLNLYRRTVELSMADPAIDLAILDRVVGEFEFDDEPGEDREQNLRNHDRIIEFLFNFVRENSDKPLVISTNMYGNNLRHAAPAEQMRAAFVTGGIPAYGSLAAAANALDRFIKYHEYQANHRE